MRLTVKNLLLVALFVGWWRFACSLCGLYRWEQAYSGREEAARIMAAVTLGSAAALALPAISVTGTFRSAAILYFALLAALMLGLTRWVARRAALRGLLARQILVVGSGRRAVTAYEELRRNSELPCQLVGFVDSPAGAVDDAVRRQLLGPLEDLESVLLQHAVDEVLIALPVRSCYAEAQEAILVCEKVGVQTRHPADVFRYVHPRPVIAESRFMVHAATLLPDDGRMRLKRCMDVVGAIALLVVLSPLLLLTALAIKLTSRGPVIFAQTRFGQNRRPFRMYKFRTMVSGAEAMQAALEGQNEADGPVFKIHRDPRITPVGFYLRHLSIDELPQLINVVLGDMSLVGPRPLPPRDVHRFTEAALMRRFSVRAGLTCLWQISGRSRLGFDDWIRLDLKYIDEWSLWLDLRILAMTVPAVFRGDGAS